MLNTKKIETQFQKMLHGTIKDKIFVTIEDYNPNTDEGIVIFLNEDFDEIYRCDPKMIQHLVWYLENPKKNYKKALNSNSPLDHAFVILDQQTGKRTIDDWNDESHKLLKILYELRKKYQ